ncbi:hypothetical protein JHK87_015174 [Glycine soja]|nr:hypothetical protein JHK87_015174 [Glycine soja]
MNDDPPFKCHTRKREWLGSMEKELVELYEAAKKAADASISGDGEHEESRCIDALEQLKKFPVNYKILVNTQLGGVVSMPTNGKKVVFLGFDNVSLQKLGSIIWYCWLTAMEFLLGFGSFPFPTKPDSVFMRENDKLLCVESVDPELVMVGKHLKVLTKHPRQKIKSFAIDLIEIWKGIIIKETSKNKNGGSDSKDESANREKSKAGKMQKSPSVKIEKGETVKVEKIERNGTSKSSFENMKKVQNDVKNERTDRAASVKMEKIAEEKPISGAKKMSSSSTAPPKLKTMIKSNDATRDKIREILHEALSKVTREADEDLVAVVNDSDPIRVAVTVESVLFEKWGPSNGAQKVKYRSLMFNLKDSNNPDFRRKVLLGVVEPEQLINMSTAEMASEQRKQEYQKITEKALFECERGGQPKATTDQFKCGRCGQRKTTYYQMQTRSADEPMTTYVTCCVCNNRWKFC